MSAWLCSDAHINFIVNFANGADGGRFTSYRTLSAGYTLDDPQALGELLYLANVVSVDYRYPHHAPADPAPDWKWIPTRRQPATLENLVKFIKALDCLEYQSCEPPTWKESHACKVIDALRSIAISSLPGYDAAPWGIE